MLTKMLSYALNQALIANPDIKEKFHKLDNKVITLICRLPIPITLQCMMRQNEFIIEAGEKFSSDTIIKGTPLQLFRTSLLNMSNGAYQIDDLVIEGDIELAENWFRLLRQIEFDFSEPLSALIGDVPYEKTKTILDKVNNLFKQNINSFDNSLNDYLHEELDFFPTQESLQIFFSDVDKLTEDTERLIARLQELRKRM